MVTDTNNVSSNTCEPTSTGERPFHDLTASTFPQVAIKAIKKEIVALKENPNKAIDYASKIEFIIKNLEDHYDQGVDGMIRDAYRKGFEYVEFDQVIEGQISKLKEVEKDTEISYDVPKNLVYFGDLNGIQSVLANFMTASLLFVQNTDKGAIRVTVIDDQVGGLSIVIADNAEGVSVSQREDALKESLQLVYNMGASHKHLENFNSTVWLKIQLPHYKHLNTPA